MSVLKQLHLSQRSTSAIRLQGRAWTMTALILLASFVLATGYSAVVHAAPQAQDLEGPTEAQRGLFTKGQTLYTQGMYSEAINTFNEFLESYPNSSIKDLTLLWLGRSYLKQGDIANAERMSLRLREIPSTPYLDIYEDELRIARHNYFRSAAPAVAPSIDQRGERFSSPAIPPDKMEIPAAVVPAPTSTVATNRPAAQDRSLQAPPAKIVPASPKVEGPGKKETIGAGALAAPAKVYAPLVRLRIEEIPSITAVNRVKFYLLVLRNEGNGAATNLVVREELDGSLDFASSDPAPARQEIVGQSLLLTYRLTGLRPGETRAIRIAVRPRPKATLKSATQIKHSVTYSDGKGNTYNTP